jgi:carbonic anhydrase/acetyltransferase-like protein (isoleucine patch superfamily)
MNWQKDLRQLADEFGLLLRSEHQVAITIFLRSQRGEDSAAHAKIGRTHVGAFLGAFKAQSNSSEIRWLHCDSLPIIFVMIRNSRLTLPFRHFISHVKLGSRDVAANIQQNRVSGIAPTASHKPMIRSYKGVTPQCSDTCYIDDSAQLIGDVIVGEHSSVWMNAVLRGDVHQIRLGHYSNIQDNCVLHGMKEQYGVYVGDYVTVGHGAILHGCRIEARCLIGMGTIILNGVVIGSGSIIAAGTLLPEKTIVEPNSLWMGSPGKFHRQLDENDQASILRYSENYIGYKKTYLMERKKS